MGAFWARNVHVALHARVFLALMCFDTKACFLASTMIFFGTSTANLRCNHEFPPDSCSSAQHPEAFEICSDLDVPSFHVSHTDIYVQGQSP